MFNESYIFNPIIHSCSFFKQYVIAALTVLSGIFLGGESLRRSLHDIVAPQRKKAFLTQIIATVTSKQSLYLRVGFS